MKVWLNRFLAISLAAAFVLTVASQANADRRTGLHGNQLIKDVTDIATFPQAASNYKNLVRIDMGGDNALFVVGDDLLDLLRRDGLARCVRVFDEVFDVEVSLVVEFHANRMRFVT